MANDQPWLSGAWAKIEVVQTSASGQPLAQSGLAGGVSGQQGISSVICMPGMALLMPSVIAGPEDATALLARPMLIGPTTTESSEMAKKRWRRACNRFMDRTFAREAWFWK